MAFPGPPEPSTMPVADWYPDPERPGRLRYWDGAEWTDHHVNESGAPTPVGDWLGRTFTVLWERIVPTLTLALLPLVFWIPAVLFARSAVSDAVLDDFDDFADTVSTSGLIIAAVFALLSFVLMSGCFLAIAHQFFNGHQGNDVGVGSSLARGLSRLPAVFVWSLAIYVPFLIIVGVLVFVAFLAPVLLIIVIPLIFVMAVFFYVRFGFMAISGIAVPKASQIVKASMSVSKGYFWPVLGRIILIALIGGVTGFIVQTIVQQGLFASTLGSFEFQTSEGEFGEVVEGVLYNGEPIGDQRLGDLLPGVVGTAIFAALYYLANIVGSILQLSGFAGLYSDARAPSEIEAAEPA